MVNNNQGLGPKHHLVYLLRHKGFTGHFSCNQRNLMVYACADWLPPDLFGQMIWK